MFVFKKIIFYLILPISIIYGVLVKVRNYFFDKGIFKSFKFQTPVICIGNLSVGGTGKTPHLIYFLEKFKAYNNGLVSRGYRRKSKQILFAQSKHQASDIGDEPKLIQTKFPKIPIVVGGKRLLTIPYLFQNAPQTNVIWMDDGFQHRKVEPSLSILLTRYNHLHSNDTFLPSGRLRDNISSGKRASLFIVTNTPSDLSEVQKEVIIQKIKQRKSQEVFFSTYHYGNVYSLFSKEKLSWEKLDTFLLVTGIANTSNLIHYLRTKKKHFTRLDFPDHYRYTQKDCKEIIKHFHSINTPLKALLITEKDAVKLQQFKELFINIPVYVLPISVKLLFSEEKKLLERINIHIQLNHLYQT